MYAALPFLWGLVNQQFEATILYQGLGNAILRLSYEAQGVEQALERIFATQDKRSPPTTSLPDLRHYAEANSYTIYKEYAEEESGSTANRTEFKKLFADAHQHKFDPVLFWSLDRFSSEGALP